jgi:hypothetical protein
VSPLLRGLGHGPYIFMANKYTDAVFEARLPGLQKLVLLTLASYSNNEDGVCWPSNNTVAMRSGLSLTTVKKVLKELVEAKFVHSAGRRPSPNGFVNLWWLDIGTITQASYAPGGTRPSDPGA